MGLLDKTDQDMKITIKKPNGASVTYHSPEGSQVEMMGILGGMVEGPDMGPTADNVMARLTPGEFVVNRPAAMKYGGVLRQINDEGKQMLHANGYAGGGMVGYQTGGMVEDEAGLREQAVANLKQGRGLIGGLFNPSEIEIVEEMNRLRQVRSTNAATPAPEVVAEPVATPVEPEVVAEPVASRGRNANPRGAPVEPVAPVVEPEVPVVEPEAPAAADPLLETGTAPAVTDDRATDENIAADNGMGTKRDLEGKTDQETVDKAAEVVGKSTDRASALENLLKETEGNIRTLEDKRKSVKLLALGISLLGGKGSTQAAQIANEIAGQDAERIEELYETRSAIIDKARAQLGLGTGVGTVGDQAFRGSDGKLYFQGEGNQWVDSNNNPKPQDVTLKGKAATEDEGDLPTHLAKQVNTLDTSIRDTNTRQAKIVNVLRGIPDDAWSGIFGRGKKTVADLLGSQDAEDVWRTQVQDLMVTEAISNLPPGVASDKDIALVQSGVLNGFANPEALKQFLAASQRLLAYSRRYDNALKEHIYANRSTSGFKPPVYDPDGADQATEGVVVSKDDDQSVDLDLS